MLPQKEKSVRIGKCERTDFYVKHYVDFVVFIYASCTGLIGSILVVQWRRNSTTLCRTMMWWVNSEHSHISICSLHFFFFFYFSNWKYVFLSIEFNRLWVTLIMAEHILKWFILVSFFHTTETWYLNMCVYCMYFSVLCAWACNCS